MINVLSSSAVDLGSSPGWVKPMTIKLVFVTSLHAALRNKSKYLVGSELD